MRIRIVGMAHDQAADDVTEHRGNRSGPCLSGRARVPLLGGSDAIHILAVPVFWAFSNGQPMIVSSCMNTVA